MTVYANLSDKNLFGNDAGEDEDIDILNSYYLDNDAFLDFFTPENSLSIVSARKGMGKSALLSRLQYKITTEADKFGNPLVIKTKGNDLLGLGDFINKDQAFLENYWKKIIIKKIIVEIGAAIGIAMSSDSISMIEIAEIDGLKSKNFIGGLISRIKGKIPQLGIELGQSIPENLEALLSNYQESHKDSIVWILIDDIDAKYQNTTEYQSRIGSFFSAIRSLSKDIPNLKIRTTVREDVWSCLRHLEDLDKIEQYIIHILWTKKQMREILTNRVLSYIKRNYPESSEAHYKTSRDYNKILDIVFQSPIHWKDDPNSNLFEAISAFSNRRPRWMGQLCRLAARKSASIPNVKRVKLEHINYIMEEYGKNRRDDLIKEHKHQFIEIEILIDALRTMPAEFSQSYLHEIIIENYIRGRSPQEIPIVDGYHYTKPEDLGNFLYKLGLISRLHDNGSKFTHFHEDPDLYKSIENKADRINWSIHPAYRTFLNIR